jgi:hypothetical protein
MLSVVSPALQYSCTLSTKRRGFRKKKVIEHKMFLDFLYNVSQMFLSLRRTKRDMIKMYIGLHIKYPLFLPDFNINWIFSNTFENTFNYQISWNPPGGNRVVPCEQTGGRTDRHDEAYSRFSQYWNAPKNKRSLLKLNRALVFRPYSARLGGVPCKFTV